MLGPKRLKSWVAALAIALGTAGVAVAQPAPKVRIELAPQTASATPGGTIYVALKQTIEPGWHTYWRNPGDSGEPTTIKWTLPAGWSAGEILWPTPERQPAPGDLLNYGYSDQVLLPVPIAVPGESRAGETVTLRADATWLVCKDVCIPEQGSAEVRLPVAAGAPRPDPRYGRAVDAVIASAPKPSGLTAAFSSEAGKLKLAVTGAELSNADLAGAYFFPFDGQAVTHSAGQAVERGPEGLTLALEAGYAFQAPEQPQALAGVLALASGQAWEIEAARGPLPPGAAGLGPPPVPQSGRLGGLTLPLAILFAFLGGLILNLMPCVFPVLGMKAAALAGHAHDRGGARRQGLAFAAGVIATFLLLAGALIGLRTAGQAVGWGFQLQSPAVVAGLAVLFLLIGLNLCSVFEVGGSVQSFGGGRGGRGGELGAFGTGALAVVVAAPCTAPFMAGAMGYALTQSAVVSLTVFLALAIGFALPFAVLSFSPALLRRLPRPGPWMTSLRRWLAVPMFAAAFWLVWVFWRQTSNGALLQLLQWAAFAGLVAVMFGLTQKGTGPGRAGWVAIAVLFGAGALAGASEVSEADRPQGETASAEAEAVGAETFTPERLAALRAEGRPVFVNLTADWCVTCKVNERTALASDRVRAAFRDSGVVYLKGDWTKRDAVIAATLAEHGRSGVPLYLLYAPGADEPKILPQLLTEGAVVRALQQARRSAGPGET